MKKIVKQLTALALALALAAGALEQTAFASEALGGELVDRTVELAEGVLWTSQSLWAEDKSDLRTENYITYTPGNGVTPMIYNGDYVASRCTVMEAAAALEAQGYRVIAGINGGFFNGNETVVGILMTGGVLRSLDLYNATLLGFTWDGRVFIDESGRTMTRTVSWETEGDSKQYKLTGFNASRNSDDLGGLYLYNQDYYSKISYSASRGCVAVLLSPAFDDKDTGNGGQLPDASGELIWTGGEGTGDDARPSGPNRNVTLNGTLTLSVEEIVDTKAGDAFNGDLTDGRYMLYANYYDGNDGLLDALRSLALGQKVTVTVGGVSEQWADAAYGITGLYTLLRDGEVVSGLSSATHPYTAVGVREDGTAVFYTIDGRKSGYSVGATYAQVAQRLKELGCVTAVALDGGGSTSLGGTLPGQQNFGLLNRPSETDRLLNNVIFLLEGDGYAGMDPGIYLSSDAQVVLAGASLNVSAVEYDRWGAEVPQTAPGTALEWSAAGGTIRGDGMTAVYTAGETAGTYAISAGSGSELPVRVVDTLNSLSVTWEGFSKEESSLDLMPRDKVELSAAGAWWNLPVALGSNIVAWEVDPSIGTIDASGVFTAKGGNEAVSGTITASAGGQTAAVQVTVQPYPFSDIESHWSGGYVIRLHELGLTSGRGLDNGVVLFEPDAEMTRGELIAFISRLLQVDTAEYQDVELPFADAGSIADWLLPDVKAMYTLGVLNGSDVDGTLMANVGSKVSREEAMTLLGRVLADQLSQDLSGFDDSGSVSDWARSCVETLVALNVVQGSGGKLSPKSNITRGEAAKLLTEINVLEKAELTPRPAGPGEDEPGTQEPDEPGGTPGAPDQPGENTDDPVSPDEPGGTPGDPGQPGENTDDPVSQDGPGGTPGDPNQPGENTDDPVSQDGPGGTPGDPDQPGENTDGPVSQDEPSVDPPD